MLAASWLKLNRSDAYGRSLHCAGTILLMIRCPICGSERVVLLTFDQEADLDPDAWGDRPLAKCVNCSYRLTAQQVMDQISTPRE